MDRACVETSASGRRVRGKFNHSLTGVCRVQVISDHMLMIKWKATEGWGAPEIVASGPIGLHPFSHVFHYAIEVYHPPMPLHLTTHYWSDPAMLTSTAAITTPKLRATKQAVAWRVCVTPVVPLGSIYAARTLALLGFLRAGWQCRVLTRAGTRAVLRGDEGIPRRRWTDAAVPAQQKHGALQ